MPSVILSALLPGAIVSYGWHLDGPGPARYGWGATSPAGEVKYLGRSYAAEVRARELAAIGWCS